jgi:precorrin-6Y C5,15-methyltransferase (decarboxylating)
VEQNPGRIEHIHLNRKRFGIGNLHVLQARLPEGLDDLPDPDRIFIGGGGRDLAEIIRRAADRLRPRGIVVVNTVLIANLTAAAGCLEGLGFDLDVVQIQVNRATPMPFSHRFQAANPVWIITAQKSIADSQVAMSKGARTP